MIFPERRARANASASARSSRASSAASAFRGTGAALFSFNSPAGACPRCQGFGNTIDYDMDLVIPDKGLTLDEGAVEPWTKPKGREWLLEAEARRGRSKDARFA